MLRIEFRFFFRFCRSFAATFVFTKQQMAATHGVAGAAGAGAATLTPHSSSRSGGGGSGSGSGGSSSSGGGALPHDLSRSQSRDLDVLRESIGQLVQHFTQLIQTSTVRHRLNLNLNLKIDFFVFCFFESYTRC